MSIGRSTLVCRTIKGAGQIEGHGIWNMSQLILHSLSTMQQNVFDLLCSAPDHKRSQTTIKLEKMTRSPEPSMRNQSQLKLINFIMKKN